MKGDLAFLLFILLTAFKDKIYFFNILADV